MASKFDAIWDPLPPTYFKEAEKRHLLRRMSFAATFEGVNELQGKTPGEAVDHLLDQGEEYPMPDCVRDYQSYEGIAKQALVSARQEMKEFRKQYGNNERMMTGKNRAKYDRIQKKIQNTETEAETYLDMVMADFALDWMRHAIKPANSVQEKLTMFLGNVLVVNLTDGLEGHPPFMHHYQAGLRKSRLEKYSVLCKRISTAPAMINMLDLDSNTKGNPNENFARELFELFILGEGSGYTEKDIREAARALTGYRYDKASMKFRFDKSLHDPTEKSVFGEKGNFNGNKVIDLTFEQEGAETYLPRRLLKEFLTYEISDSFEPYIQALGKQWRENEFSLRWLFKTFFTSKAFFNPKFRGTVIKSPIQLYLGLVQDLRLDVTPFARRIQQFMNLMGQDFMDPPDVEGWPGGIEWFTNSTIQTRRMLIESMFVPMDRSVLTATERKNLKKIEYDGRDASLNVSMDRIGNIVDLPNDQIVDRLMTYFLPTEVEGRVRLDIMRHMANAGSDKDAKDERIRQVVMAILQHPYYQLC